MVDFGITWILYAGEVRKPRLPGVKCEVRKPTGAKLPIYFKFIINSLTTTFLLTKGRRIRYNL